MRQILSPLDGFGSPFGPQRGFNPRKLFALGEQGAWYDPSDLTTLFTDTAGTTPATVGSAVALMLDKSRGLIDLISNGDFASNVNGWTASTANVVAEWDAGRIKVTNNGAGWVYQAVPTVIGQRYTALANYVTKNGGGRVFIGTSIGSSSLGGVAVAGDVNVSFIATTTTTFISLGDSAGGSGVINIYDNIRVIPGNHATQSVLAQRPILRQTAGGLYYLECDGLDDGMVTSAINFTATDAMTVFAGVRKLSDAAVAILFETSANAASNAGSFGLTAPENTTTIRYATYSRGSVNPATLGRSDWTASGASPDSAVLTGIHSISGDLSRIRRNGVNGPDATADKGTGNFGNHILYLFRRAGATLPFNGNFYGGVILGRTATAAEITNTERFMAQKTGVTL